MIVADQDVSTLELTELYRIGKEHYGLDDKEINFAIISEGPGFYSPERVEDKIKYLYELALIACADGKIEDEEKITEASESASENTNLEDSESNLEAKDEWKHKKRRNFGRNR